LSGYLSTIAKYYYQGGSGGNHSGFGRRSNGLVAKPENIFDMKEERIKNEIMKK